MVRKIRIGILGCANIAKRMVIPNVLNSGLYELVAISSRSKEKADEFASLFNCESIIGYECLLRRPDIELVYIPLPIGLHYEWIMKALSHGKHVFAEKSISSNYKEVSEIIKLADSKELLVFENFMFPFHSQYRFVKDKINSNAIGEIKLLRSSFGFPIFDSESNFRYSKHLGGGALLDAGAYTIMASQFMLGSKQEVVGAYLTNENREVDFQGSVLLRNQDGIVSQLAFGFDNFYQNSIELWGNKGKITIERAFTPGPEFTPKIIMEQHGLKSEFSLSPDNHCMNILKKIYNCILGADYKFMYDTILNQSNLLTRVMELAKVEL